MCMCVYVCVFFSSYIWVCIYMYVYVCVYDSYYVSVYIYAYIVCVYIYIYIYICSFFIYIYIYIYTHVNVGKIYMCILICILLHLYIYIYITRGTEVIMQSIIFHVYVYTYMHVWIYVSKSYVSRQKILLLAYLIENTKDLVFSLLFFYSCLTNTWKKKVELPHLVCYIQPNMPPCLHIYIPHDPQRRI